MWQAVIETPTYLSDARNAGLTEPERDEIVMFLSANPGAGTVMPGTGGARKVRIAGRGKGKSGGYRVVTFFAGEDTPVFLLALVDKGDRERSDAEGKERTETRALNACGRVRRRSEETCPISEKG